MPDLTPKKERIPPWVSLFIDALRNSGNVRAACQRAGISRPEAYRRKNTHPGFAKQWQEALDDAIDVLEAVAWGRAQKKSDTLLIFLLKAHRPDMYREVVRQENTGKDGGPIQVSFITAIRNELKGAAQVTGGGHDAEAGAGESPVEMGAAPDAEDVAP